MKLSQYVRNDRIQYEHWKKLKDIENRLQNPISFKLCVNTNVDFLVLMDDIDTYKNKYNINYSDAINMLSLKVAREINKACSLI